MRWRASRLWFPKESFADESIFLRRRVARLRSTLLKAVTPADLREVMASLLAKAKAGEVAAIKELFQRAYGRVGTSAAS